MADTAIDKADRKRAALLDRLVDHVLDHGLSNASLRPLAAAVGTSDRMLIYYFGDKATLIASILTHGAGRMAAALDQAMPASRRPWREVDRELHQLILSEQLWPFMKLGIEIAARAAFGDEICKLIGGQIFGGFVDWIASRIDVEGEEGYRLAAQMLRDKDAAAMLQAVGLERINDLLAP